MDVLVVSVYSQQGLSQHASLLSGQYGATLDSACNLEITSQQIMLSCSSRAGSGPGPKVRTRAAGFTIRDLPGRAVRSESGPAEPAISTTAAQWLGVL
jgi:hypothetical protein